MQRKICLYQVTRSPQSKPAIERPETPLARQTPDVMLQTVGQRGVAAPGPGGAYRDREGLAAAR